MPDNNNTHLTGYPSIDKPWLKYYSEEAINAPLPEMTMYRYIWKNNKDHLSDVQNHHYRTDIALRYYGAKISYDKLFDNIKQAASSFYAMGVRSGDMVTVMSMHTPETIYALYALNYIGAVANMVYMTLSEKEILHTLENTASKAFLVLDPALERVRNIAEKITCPIVVLHVSDSMPAMMKLGYKLKAKAVKHSFENWKDFMNRGKSEPPLATNHAAPAVIVYTSGTTGDSKGVLLSSDNINAVIHQVRTSGTVFLRRETLMNNIPTFLAYGIAVAHLSLATGMEMYLHLIIVPEEIAKGIVKTKPKHYIGGPIIVDPLMQIDQGDMSWLNEFIGGGEGISPEKEAQFNQFLRERGCSSYYCSGFGMSELSSAVSLQQNHAYRFGSVGLPLAHNVFKSVDPDTGEELPYEEIGELCVASPSMMIGYYQNDKETNRIIREDGDGVRWLYTGDLGYIDKDGFVFHKGRMKRIYSTVGKNRDIIQKIFPDRIEECIEARAEVESCGVIVIPDEVQFHVSIAFAKLKEECKGQQQTVLRSIEEGIRKDLPDHLWPREIRIIDAMPITQSGKIDYKTLEKRLEKETIKNT